MRIMLASAALLMVFGCGEDFTIDDQPLTGTIGGEAWTFVAGDTDNFLSDDRFFSSLYSGSFEACGFSGPAGSSLILNIPMSTGSYDLSLSLNMTFVVDTGDEIENLIATDGLLRIDSITSTTIGGGIAMSFDADNSVNGLFEIDICPDDPV